MKRTIVTLVVMLIAPLAFAQTGSTHKKPATTTEPITVTGTIIPTPEEGAAAAHQPAKTFVVREDKSNHPGRYVLNGPGHVVDKSGDRKSTRLNSSHVSISYAVFCLKK